MDDDKQTLKYGTVITVKSLSVTNGNVQLIDKNKIQRLLKGFSLACPLTGA